MARHGLNRAAPPTTPLRHVKRTLPPTLTTFPGLAEIRYYVKVTVNRKEFYKENPRVVQNLNFFPIEPPRGAPTGAESYARRQHNFSPTSELPNKGKNRLFDAFKKPTSTPTATQGTSEPPTISVDVRLPTPAIITCSEDLPMRIVIKRLNDSSEPLFLQSLHVQLHGITRIKASEIFRDESSNWVIVSKSNMGFPLQSSKAEKTKVEKTKVDKTEEQGEEIVLDPGLWRKHPLPNSVSPSFETCNITRTYELEVHVGIGFRSASANNVGFPERDPVSEADHLSDRDTTNEACHSSLLRNRTPSSSARSNEKQESPTSEASTASSAESPREVLSFLSAFTSAHQCWA